MSNFKPPYQDGGKLTFVLTRRRPRLEKNKPATDCIDKELPLYCREVASSKCKLDGKKTKCRCSFLFQEPLIEPDITKSPNFDAKKNNKNFATGRRDARGEKCSCSSCLRLVILIVFIWSFPVANVPLVSVFTKVVLVVVVIFVILT